MQDVISFLEDLFPPDPDLPLDRTRRLADDESLWQIACADYGQQADEMYVLLRSIRDTGELPSPIPGLLEEVLSLSRWHDPDSPGNPPNAGLVGHKTRLFVAAILLKMAADPAVQYQDTAFDSTLAVCLHSAGIIGDGITRATGSFLTWAIHTGKWDWPHGSVFLSLGLLVCASRCSQVTDNDLGHIGDWVLAAEASAISALPAPGTPEPVPFSITQGFWKPLAEELRSRAKRIPIDAARTNLECCALLLEPGA